MLLMTFFSYATDFTTNTGFSLFGRAHLIWLFSIFFSLGIFLFFFYKCTYSVKERILHIVGWSPILFEGLRLLYLSFIHHLTLFELPLHLCGLAGFLCLLHAKTKWDWTGQTLFTACLPGTISALLFPDWTKYPIMNIFSMQGFFFHAAILYYCSAMLVGNFCFPQLKKIWKPILFLSIVIPPIYLFNYFFHSNYMFLQIPSAGSPLIWIAKITGTHWYLLGYAIFALSIMISTNLLYILFQQIFFFFIKLLGLNPKKHPESSLPQNRSCNQW